MPAGAPDFVGGAVVAAGAASDGSSSALVESAALGDGVAFGFATTGRSMAISSETVTNLKPFARRSSMVCGIASTVVL